MAQPGDELVDPAGTRLVFAQTAGSTGGAGIALEWRVPPGRGLVQIPHVHPFDAESFEILAGRARYRVGRHVRERDAPYAFAVPAGAIHVHPVNAGAGELRLRQSLRPDPPNARLLDGVERYFETEFALAQRGGLTRRGWILDPLQSAVTLGELLLPATVLPWLPHGLQRAALGGLGALARRLGYTAHLEPVRAVRPPSDDPVAAGVGVGADRSG